MDCPRKDTSLDATTAFTLQAWANPNSGNGTNIIIKGTPAELMDNIFSGWTTTTTSL